MNICFIGDIILIILTFYLRKLEKKLSFVFGIMKRDRDAIIYSFFIKVL